MMPAVSLENLEGARLENVGVMKMILDYATISWITNLDDLTNRKVELQAEIDQITDSFCKSENCMIILEGYKDILRQHENILNFLVKMTSDLEGSERSRSKRWDALGSGLKSISGILDAEDRRNINQALNDLETSREKNSNELQILDEKLEKLQGKLNEIDKTEIVAMKVLSFCDDIETLVMMIVTEKVSGNIEEMLKTSYEAISSLGNSNSEIGMSLPASLVSLKVRSEFVVHGVQFSIEFPFVEKKISKIFKFIATPVKVENLVLLTNFDNFTYFAVNNESEMKTIKNLNDCIKTSNEVFLCDSDTAKTSTSLCLSSIIDSKIIDAELCAENILIAKLPEVVMIENEYGDLWFSSENQRSVEIACRGENEKLSVYGNGMVDTKECKLKISDDNKSITYSKIFESKILEDIYPPLLIDGKAYKLEELMRALKIWNQVYTNPAQKSTTRQSNPPLLTIIKWILIVFTIATIFLTFLSALQNKSVIIKDDMKKKSGAQHISV